MVVESYMLYLQVLQKKPELWALVQDKLLFAALSDTS